MLHFYYGVMGSSKTAQLLMQRYNYQQLGLRVALVKPAVDTRMKKGTSPTQARPSTGSTDSQSGNRRCTTSGSNDQCRNVRVSHRLPMTGSSTSNGQTGLDSTTTS